MRRIIFAVLIFIIPFKAAQAAEAVPGGSCSGFTANAFQWAGGPENSGVTNGMFCNGTNSTWTGVINFQSSGNVGIGTTGPATALDVVGTLRSTTQVIPSSGVGTELFYAPGASQGKLLVYNRSSPAYSQLSLDDTIYVGGGLTGNVGIGTASPAYPLHLYSTSNTNEVAEVENADTAGGSVAGLTIKSDNTPYTHLDIIGNGGAYWWYFGTNGIGASGGTFLINDVTTGNSPLEIEKGAATNSIHINSSGYVGIGKAAPTAALDVVGNIQFTGQMIDASDRRLKHDIKPLPSGQLAKLEQLQPVSYVMNANPKQPRIGFIAQDVQPIFPDLIFTDPTGLRSMDYVSLVAPIVAGMQEQQREIRILWAALIVVTLAGFTACFILWRSKQARSV